MLDEKPAIFHTLQGEGPYAGTPAVFVRTALCNLSCTWCDTPYTWDWSRYPKAQYVRALSLDTVSAAVNAYAPRHVVLTGGEPLLQQAALTHLIRALSTHPTIEIETNGTQQPKPALDAVVHAYNVSLKLPHSGQSPADCIFPDTVRWFAQTPTAWFKFVVQTPADVTAILALAKTYAIPHARIGLMPEGTDSESLRAASPWIVQACLRHQFRFLDRLHIHVDIA